MPVKDQKITVEKNETIHIIRENKNVLAMTTYDEIMLKELKTLTWTPNAKGYMTNRKYGSLHKYVMGMKLGHDVVQTAMNNNFVIDHLNNNGLDCRYTNLELIPRMQNASKGLFYDIERKKYVSRFAVNFSKDIESSEFQISICFNERFSINLGQDKIPLSVLYLKYGNDYTVALLEAQIVLHELQNNSVLDLNKLRCTKLSLRKAYEVILPENYNGGPFVNVDGEVMIIQGHPDAVMVEAGHDKELHK